MQERMELKTQLTDRTLWYDGVVEVDPDKVVDLLLKGFGIEDISVTLMSPEVEQFNSISEKKLSIKNSCNVLDTSFLIPDEYKNMDLLSYFLYKQMLRNDSNFENEKRVTRIENELAGYKEKKYTEVLCAIIYLVDTLTKNKVVWGVGRGSSCASYLLFLTGLHLVDPIKYGIHYSEFLHD